MPTQSIFRGPGARHFQVVHRSQRDPLIHDSEASQSVLKPVERSNIRKGKTRAELEASLSPNDLVPGDRIGQASLYGVYYDDTEYDYMQHLRPFGVQEEGVESILIEVPSSRKRAPLISLEDLPPEVLASSSEIPRNYESQEAIPSSIAGLQPDMNPHLRQVLEALEDDAFVDDELREDFFSELVADGEVKECDMVPYEFHDDGELNDSNAGEEDSNVDERWEVRYASFKKNRYTEDVPATSDDGEHSEGGDTVGRLPPLPVIGGKRRRKGTSDASGYSRSRSSLVRTETLQTLDERFDQLMCKEYGDESENAEQDDASSHTDDDGVPELITSRPDFEAMMNDFLDNHEVLGKRLKPKVEGESGLDTLTTIRRTLGKDDHNQIYDEGENDDDADLLIEEKERWDCETILTTYSNLENHPRLIRAREVQSVTKIRLDPKSGLPSTHEAALPLSKQGVLLASEVTTKVIRETIARPKDESKEDKKARKTTAKADRQARRKDKKATKEQFKTERQHQLRDILSQEKSKMRKL